MRTVTRSKRTEAHSTPTAVEQVAPFRHRKRTSPPWAVVVSRIAARASWFPVLVFLVHVVAARILMIYELFPRFDLSMHLIGGIAIAYFFAHSLAVLEGEGVVRPADRGVRMVLLFALVCTAAVFWEFAEYLSDHTIGTQAQQGLEDTLLDMLLGIIGGSGYLLVRNP